ncbi:hypothetical protein BKA65DRAFT_570398 [Rhexocercosporidium sp. MPI-PUGE-AT-0058]|nr:hypothetical protein BKA65DRAFT_570398 [Rhexocercosporidium sp. MPI-PUGE-AT-0058]
MLMQHKTQKSQLTHFTLLQAQEIPHHPTPHQLKDSQIVIMNKLNKLTCALCDSEDAVPCTCKSAAFCQASCEAECKRVHNLLCEKLNRWGWETPRPAEDCFIGIYYPVDGTEPELYWSRGRLKVQKSETTGMLEEIDLLSVDEDEVISGDVEINCNVATKSAIPVPLNFVVRDTRGIDGSQVNLSILETTRGDQRGLWAGPAVLFCHNEHVSLADLTYFTNFIKMFRDKEGSLKHALRVGQLSHVEITRPDLFNAVKEMAGIRKEARDAASGPSASPELENRGIKKKPIVTLKHALWRK